MTCHWLRQQHIKHKNCLMQYNFRRKTVCEVTDREYPSIKHGNNRTYFVKAELDWAESNLLNIMRVGEVESPSTSYYPDLSKPITKGRKILLKYVFKKYQNHEHKNSRVLFKDAIDCHCYTGLVTDEWVWRIGGWYWQGRTELLLEINLSRY